MKEILPGIFTWHEFSEEKKLNFNGYLIVSIMGSVLIDPPELTEDNFAELEILVNKNSKSPLQAILLTNVHHERECHKMRKIFSIPVLINEKDDAGLERKADKTFADGDTLPGGFRTFKFENQKSPGESAFYLKDRGIMILGDALIGKVPGKLNMLPHDKYRDPKLAKRGLNKLLDYEFESLLLGDGESILNNAKEAVKVFLES
jgi:glyoxylase-like metal-dependent hydrolase (beta-lactamase superfamily II)